MYLYTELHILYFCMVSLSIKTEHPSTSIAETDETVLIIKGIQGRINRAVWGPLNKTIISGGEDSVVRIWDAEVKHMCFSILERGFSIISYFKQHFVFLSTFCFFWLIYYGYIVATWNLCIFLTEIFLKNLEFLLSR